MPMTGLEPVRTRRQILSLLCLPIPPHGHVSQGAIIGIEPHSNFFEENCLILSFAVVTPFSTLHIYYIKFFEVFQVKLFHSRLQSVQ